MGLLAIDAVTSPPQHPLWAFSVAFYGKPGVASRLLCLQDDWGVDVNLLLAALWWTFQGGRLDRHDAEVLQHRSLSERQHVATLRAERRRCDRTDVRYPELKALELDAEARVQGLLYHALLELPISPQPGDPYVRALEALRAVTPVDAVGERAVEDLFYPLIAAMDCDCM